MTREPVEAEDKGRGYEYAKGSFILIEDDELDAVAIESTHAIEIDTFVPREQIDERYFDNPYYICPNDHVGQDAFAVIREAMRVKGMAAFDQIVLNKRAPDHAPAVGQGVMATTLRYPYELRNSKDYFDDIPEVKVPDEMLKLAQHILETKTDDFDPSQFVGRYKDPVVAMLKKRQAGLPTPKEKPAAPAQNVVTLMDALRKSLAQDGKKPKPKKRAEGGQREMLLPIAGKGGKDKEKAPAKKARLRKTG